MQLHLPFLESPDPPAREVQPPSLAPLAVSEVESAVSEVEPVVSGVEPSIDFVRVPRARRYILRVRPDGSLRVTVPRGGSRREAEQFVRRQQRWIARERGRVLLEHGPHAWQHGREILLNGEPVRIEVESRDEHTVITYGVRQIVTRAAADVRAAIEHDLRTLAKADLVSRLRALASEHGLSIGEVTIRNQRSRWGSCARNGNIALNFRLVQMPPGVRDYVLIHELMHIKQQNHSRKFWRLVEAAYPAFREAERWLRTTGKSLF